MNHLNAFIEMLDSQHITYKKYELTSTIEIAIPAFNGWSCYEFDVDGRFKSLWDRDYAYADLD